MTFLWSNHWTFFFVSYEILGLNLHVASYVKPCLECHVLVCCRHTRLLHLSPMAISTSHEGLTCNFLPTKRLFFVYGILHELIRVTIKNKSKNEVFLVKKKLFSLVCILERAMRHQILERIRKLRSEF